MLSGLLSHAEAATDSGVLRVKLSIGTVTSFSFYVDGNYTVGNTVLERQPYTAKVESGKVSLYLGGALIASGDSVSIVQRAATSGRNNFLYLDNALYGFQRYLGDLCFTVSGGSLLLVNNIDLEQYLYGVVPYEMSDSWPVNALKAQAVAARNYAVKRLGGGGSYAITDDSSYDQVYRGFNPSYTNAIAAVNATASSGIRAASPPNSGICLVWDLS
jgi:peptidoglycan hydrolase-like amidase